METVLSNNEENDSAILNSSDLPEINLNSVTITGIFDTNVGLNFNNSEVEDNIGNTNLHYIPFIISLVLINVLFLSFKLCNTTSSFKYQIYRIVWVNERYFVKKISRSLKKKIVFG